MKSIFYPVLAILAIVGAGSCNIINPAESVPTYVHIDSFTFQKLNSQSTTTSHKITNILVYFNNQSIGNFDLPVTFPVIMNQPGVLTMRPGIDVDGLTGYEAPYLHYLADTLTISPNPGKTINYTPKTKYSSYTTLTDLSSFNSSTNFTFLDGSGYFDVTKAGSGLGFEGNSGLIVLSKAHGVKLTDDDSLVYLSAEFAAPYAGLPYLELNYRSTMPLQIGMVTTNPSTGDSYQEYIVGLNPRATWGKVYIALDYFAQLHINTKYHLVLRADRFADDAVDSALIDNLVIIHQ